jgi:heptosyltransferase-1
MKVLIVKLSALGDILHAMPAVRSLMLSRPDLEIGWAVDRRYSSVMGLFEGLSHLHVVDPKGWGRNFTAGSFKKAIGDLRRQVEDIRRVKYDAALDIQGLIKSALLSKFSGAGFVAGFSREICREPFSARFYRDKVNVDTSLPVSRQIMSLLTEVMDVPGELADPGLTVPERAGVKAEQILADYGAGSPVVLVVGAGWKTKVLPPDSFRKVARALAKQAPVIALAGNEEEKVRAELIIDGINRGGVIYREEIPVLAGVFERARLVIGGDTGLIHMAAHMGTPTVSFYGASLGARSGPEGPKHSWVQSEEDCSPCFERECDNLLCMDSITPERIVAKAKGVLAKYEHG